ncbi:MAG: arginine deiminase-related protein, partial [Pseudomonadota bacterium]|nr:arginine deiminase-related protein [Pseudomonadota bacterium]
GIPREDQRDAVLRRLADTEHEVVTIDFDQMDAFAGNMLELRSVDGERILAMSEQAKQSLDVEQMEKLAANAQIVSAPIDRIESSAGGSVRCMLAEIHLNKRL